MVNIFVLLVTAMAITGALWVTLITAVWPDEEEGRRFREWKKEMWRDFG